MNDNKQLDVLGAVTTELSHAGEDPEVVRAMAQLDNCRITPDSEIPPMEFLFEMFNRPCFPRGELVAVSGKAKSGKTFVCSMLMALCYSNSILNFRRMGESNLRLLWYDTEQSEESTQDILKHRVLRMIPSADGNPWKAVENDFHVFNVRSKMWQERMPLLEAAMKSCQPDLVVLDGVRDLVNDINDGVMAQAVIERLMNLASQLRCCIVCVLHQNKGSEDKNLRGWIGTELRNKAFEVYECTKDADRIFSCNQTDTRKYDIVDKLKYVVNSDGIPEVYCSEIMHDMPLPLNNLRRPAFNERYVLRREGNWVDINTERLFTDALKDAGKITATHLQEKVMHMANITSYKYYHRLRGEALDKGVIRQLSGPNSSVMYSLAATTNSVTSTTEVTQPSLFNGMGPPIPY